METTGFTDEEEDSGGAAPLAGLLRVSGLTFFSRILGLVRDAAMAATFGNGLLLDAFSLAFRLPNLTRRLFGESAFSTAFLPIFVRELDLGGRAAAGALATAVLSMTGMIVSAISAVCVVALLLGRSLAAGDETRLLLGLTAALFPYQVFICLAAQAVAILHAFGRFTLPAVLPIIGNVIWLVILGATAWYGLPPRTQIYWIAAGIVLGGVAQALITIPALKQLNLPFSREWRRAAPRVREILAAIGPVLVGLSITEINCLVDGLMAWLLTAPIAGGDTSSLAFLPSGTAASLYLGQRLFQFPLALVGVAMGTILLPRFTRHALADRLDALRDDLILGLKLSLAIGVPASCGLVLLARPLADVLFRYGTFDETDMLQTTWGIAGYGIGVWAFIGLVIANRGFYALGDRRTPLRLGTVSAMSHLAISGSLVWIWGGFGLALGTSLAAAVQVLLTLLALARRQLAPPLTSLIDAVVRVVLATAGMALVCVVLRDVPAWSTAQPGRIASLFVPVCGGIASYAILSQLLGLRELRELIPRRVKGG